MDRFESNDTAATATDLRTISGTTTETALSIEANNLDWYKFTLASAGRTGDAVSIAFNTALGDLDLRLYGSNGSTLLGTSNGTGNAEQISLAGLAAGTYYARVDGYSGASNPSYSLSVTAAPTTSAADRFEPNDTAATATDLRTISGTTTETGLSIEANNLDWYKFTLASAGRTGDVVSIAFNTALGDLDLRLYASNGSTLLGTSIGTGNAEQISLAGLAAGTYYARVDGYSGASNPSYSLSVVAAPTTSAADRFEPNDTAATATDLRTISGTTTETGLSIEANNLDWYKFTLASAGRTGDAVSIAFNTALGDLDLRLYGSNGSTLLGTSDGTGNSEQISLGGLAAGTYYARVDGYSGASNPSYSLSVAAAATTGFAADQWESNNTSAQATAIRQTAQTFNNATLTVNDQDWYSFTLPAAGALADQVRVLASGGNVVTQILNAQSQVISTGQSDANGLTNLSLANLAAGQYFVKVAGSSASTQAQYNLDVRAVGVTAAAVQDTWTILVYVDGDNNLEDAAIADINEMEAALTRSGINVGVLVDRIGGYDTSNGNWTDTRRGVISHDNNTSTISSSLTSVGEIDMGRAQSLTDFINWGASNLPAQHYAVVIWDHGGGTFDGSAFDDTSQSHLSNRDVRRAIEASTLQRVDLIGFDACLMASVEIAAELAPVASRLVASVLTEPGDGWDYTTFLNQFSAAPGPSASVLAGTIVDSYGAWYRNQQTLSAIDLAQVATIEQSLDAFVTTMRSASTADWAVVKQARLGSATSDSGREYSVDIVNFMTRLMAGSSNAAIDSAAQAVISAVQASVIRNVGPAGFSGLTVVFPSTAAQRNLSTYTASTFQFVQDSAWEDFLTLYLGATRDVRATGAVRVGPDFAESLDMAGNARFNNNDTVSTAYDLGLINQSVFKVPSLNIETVTDVDWFRFSLPVGSGLTPNLTITVADSAAGVSARLLNSAQVTVAQSAIAAGSTKLNFSQLEAGAAYFLEVRGIGASSAPAYELQINAFGSNPPADPTADFAEANGGNNSLGKAFAVGGASDLQRVGALRNLSFNAADLQGGVAGGDWFRVHASRTTEANANRVAITDVSNASGDLDLRVYDINGNLLAESATRASSTEAVAFASQVSDVYVQVFTRSGLVTTSYSLVVSNVQSPVLSTEGGSDDDVLVDTSGGGSVLRGRGGNDSIDGRDGIDTSAYTGTIASSTWARTVSGWSVATATEGTDTLVNIERLQFADANVALDLSGNAGIVAKTLGAVFGKSAVATEAYVGIGLYFVDGGMNYEAFMQLAINARLGVGASHQSVVDLLYTNLVGSAPTAGQSAGLVSLLDSHTYSVAGLGVLAADTSLNTSNIGLVGLEQQGLKFVPFVG